jgi:hypothetical protein
MDCLHCGKKLSMVKKLTTGEFCSAAHKKAYLQEQEKFALARLLENQSRLSPKKDFGEVAAAHEAAQANAAAKAQERLQAKLQEKKRAPRSKTKQGDTLTPVEGEYLVEKVRASQGPKYLALPEIKAEMAVEPVLPELEIGLDLGASTAPAEAAASLAPPEPVYAVNNRFGLEALFRAAEQESIHAELVGMPEFGAYAGDLGPRVVAPTAVWDLLGVMRRPPGACEIDPEWVEGPTRRASRAFEAAIDHLASQELSADSSEGVISMHAALIARAATDRVELDPCGPKRFAFSRMPESTASVSTVADFELGGACTTNAVAPKAMAAAVSAPFGSAPGGLWEPPRVEMLWPSPELGAHRAAITMGEQVANALAPVEAALLPGDPRGAYGQIGAEFGYLSLPSLEGKRANAPDVRATAGKSSDVYTKASVRPKPPRGPYDLSAQNRYFPPPARIASVPRLLAPSAQPPWETRLVAIEIPAGSGAAPKGKLRANRELAFGRGGILLPKIKHKIRPAKEHESVYAALGQLTAGNRDFSFAGLKKHWNLAPNDLRWVAMAIPIVISLIWYSSLSGDDAVNKTSESAEVAASAPAEPGLMTKIFGDDSMREVKASIQRRAAVELSDDFRQGLGDWSGVGDWAQGWSYDRAGFLRPRQIAFYTPSLELTDYRFEFLGQIERKALSWVFRAADARNYYVNRLEIVEPGPLPEVVLVRYPVIGGKAGARKVTRLPMQVQMDTLYRIRVDVAGQNFVTTVQGQVVDVFSDDRISRGGVGFFAGPGEDVRLRWVEVSHQYDFLGRLCAFLVPYNVSNNNMRSGQ